MNRYLRIVVHAALDGNLEMTETTCCIFSPVPLCWIWTDDGDSPSPTAVFCFFLDVFRYITVISDQDILWIRIRSWCVFVYHLKEYVLISHAGKYPDRNASLIVFVFLLFHVLSGRRKLLSTREISTGLEWLCARRFSGLRYVYVLKITKISEVFIR